MKTKKSHKLPFLLALSSVVLVGLYLSLAHTQHYWPFQPTAQTPATGVNYGATTDEQKKNGDVIKDQTITSANDKTTSNTGSDASPTPVRSTTNTNQKPNASMQITTATVQNDIISIRTVIQVVSNSGVCTLSIFKAQSVIYTATAGAQASSSTSTCKGFSIPVSAVGSGTVTIKIHYENTSVVADTSKELTI